MSKRKADPFERYVGDGRITTTRRYAVPIVCVKEIRNVTPIYGSQGRAIQVGTEILIRSKRPVKVACEGKLTYMTYKLLPRTIELIDELREKYGSHASVFCAVLSVLKAA